MQHYKTEVHTLDANTEEQKEGDTNILKQTFLVPEVAEIYICKSSIPPLPIKDLYVREEMQACTMKRDRAYLNFVQCGLHKFRKHKILATTTFLKVNPLNFVQEPQEKPNARII